MEKWEKFVKFDSNILEIVVFKKNGTTHKAEKHKKFA